MTREMVTSLTEPKPLTNEEESIRSLRLNGPSGPEYPGIGNDPWTQPLGSHPGCQAASAASTPAARQARKRFCFSVCYRGVQGGPGGRGLYLETHDRCMSCTYTVGIYPMSDSSDEPSSTKRAACLSNKCVLQLIPYSIPSLES